MWAYVWNNVNNTGEPNAQHAANDHLSACKLCQVLKLLVNSNIRHMFSLHVYYVFMLTLRVYAAAASSIPGPIDNLWSGAHTAD